MNDQTKHYLKVGLILCAICTSAALLIGGANLLTAQTIERNTIAKKENAMKEIFTNAVSFSDEQKLDLTYCSSFYVAYSDENKTNEIGDIYYASGKNAYGSVTLMVGIDYSTGKHNNNIQVIENTESYAGTLEDEYLKVIQAGGNIEDVKCGATYGAKLVRDMILEAETNYQERHQ